MMKFMNGIKDQVRKIIDVEINNTVKFEDSGNDGREVLALCPRCNRNIYENSKSFSCSGWKCKPKCTYSLWKDDKVLTDKGIVLNSKIAKELIANNSIKVTSQSDEEGKSIDYMLSLEENGKYLNYRLVVVE